MRVFEVEYRQVGKKVTALVDATDNDYEGYEGGGLTQDEALEDAKRFMRAEVEGDYSFKVVRERARVLASKLNLRKELTMYHIMDGPESIAYSRTREAALYVLDSLLKERLAENSNLTAVGYRHFTSSGERVTYHYYDGEATFAVIGILQAREV